MIAIVLAAVHGRRKDSRGIDVPYPLLDLEGEPYLTNLVRKLSDIDNLRRVVVITNDVIKADLDEWAATLTDATASVEVISDGTKTPEERLGAVGDLLYALRRTHSNDDVVVVGGDNWFMYSLPEFIAHARCGSPAMVVSPLRPGSHCSRFGMVDMADGGRITRFIEKPESSALTLKSSCVYFFAALDLKWLEEFSKDHSTNCSPGVFFAWLVERTSVYGVKMNSTWYDMDREHHPSDTGPDHLKLREILRRYVGVESSTWERMTSRQLQWISTCDDLIDILSDDNPNRRIVASIVLGHAMELASAETKKLTIEALCKLLADPCVNQCAYAAFQEDDDNIVYVSTTAAEALQRIGYAKDLMGVFQRARQEGYSVVDPKQCSSE